MGYLVCKICGKYCEDDVCWDCSQIIKGNHLAAKKLITDIISMIDKYRPINIELINELKIKFNINKHDILKNSK